MDDKKRKWLIKYLIFCGILCIGLAIFTGSLYIKANFRDFDHYKRYMQLKLTHPGLSDEYDELRQELKGSIEAADIYTIKDGDYVESVSATVVYDDIHIGSSWSNTDVILVTIQMKEGFDKMHIQDRCQIFVNLRDEIEPVLSDLYLSSSYYELFDTYKYDLKSPYMDYRGRELSLRQHTTFSFSDDTYEYSLGYSSVTMKISDTSCREYSFKILDGQITEFRDLYKEGLIDSNGNIKKDSKDSDGNSSGSSGKKDTTSSGSGSGYDPYDVHDYDNADDFADDKYEEFYEYEDDYEDEDEAYDAAEDYWYDEY
jgi:hypothetical protein